MGGGVFEQGYASLVTGCGACFADCWTSRLVVVGSPWRMSLDNPSCRTFLQRTRVQWELFDYNNRARTVSNANPAHVTAMFQFAWVSGKMRDLLPCRAMDYLWTPWRYAYVSSTEKAAWVRVLRRTEGKGRLKDLYCASRHQLFRHFERVSLYTGPCDGGSVRPLGRIAEVAGRGC